MNVREAHAWLKERPLLWAIWSFGVLPLVMVLVVVALVALVGRP